MVTETDISGLGRPAVIEALDYEAILMALMADANARFAAAGIPYNVGTLETDPVKIVLEVAAYPTITYEAPSGRTTVKPAGANQYDVGLAGELTLHGTTRTHPINARVLIHGDMLRASGEVPIQQPDYKLKPVKVPGSMMKVKDEVKLTFDIVARK